MNRSRELLSIVIPALDEEAILPRCLAAVRQQEAPYETLVVDGGSSDGTMQAARDAGARVLVGPRGRALQMNQAAREARGDVLLFLHADTILPPNALRAIRRAVGEGIDAGAFRLRYDRAGVSLRLAGWLSDLHCRRTGDLFGDRALFVRRSTFEELGGFRILSLLEDLDFAMRLRARGRAVRILDAAVVTSSRRFRSAGIWRSSYRAWRLVRAFHSQRPLDRSAVEFYTSVER